MTAPIILRAGPVALARIRQHGLRAADIAVVPAAAGGPKGLILQALDQWLFGHWLPGAPRQRSLIGASIGSWRMAAACMTDPVEGFARLGELYCGQTYPPKPDQRHVTAVIDTLLEKFLHGQTQSIIQHPLNRLHIITSKGRGLLRAPRPGSSARLGFVAAGLANLGARSQLAHHLERCIIGDARDPLPWLRQRFDSFPTTFAALSANNLRSALLASGTLPMIMEPVRDIQGTPAGTYWDGGLVDYHLALPYARLNRSRSGSPDPDPSDQDTQLVLYPHFGDQIIPGWLDKAFAWRRAHKGQHTHWIDNLVLVAPSPTFIRTLPDQKLPDRKDFNRYGIKHEQRAAAWQRAIKSGDALRDALAEFVEQPDLALLKPF